MATNHTEHYQLNLWEPTDKFVREEFNENNQKIDAALKAEADARTAADSALQTTLALKAQIAAGHYTGDGAETRFISVGFTPKAVFVIRDSGSLYSSGSYGGSSTYGGLAVTGHSSGTSHPAVQIVSGGFNVSCSGQAHSNDNSSDYNYIALG